MNGWPIELGLMWTSSWRSRGWSAWSDRVKAHPRVQPGSVWIHGASLGECALGRRLANELDRAVVTSDTRAGLAWADQLRPFDHPWTLAPLWSEARPTLLVMLEGAWWPGLVALARRASVPVVVVGARISPTKRLTHEQFGWPDAVWAQDDDAARWFGRHCEILGVGTLKGASIQGGRKMAEPFLVGMSTRAGDEERLLQARDAVAPSHRLVLAPRDLRRVPMLREEFPLLRLPRERCDRPADILLDTFGHLTQWMVGADVAFVGGTFDARRGGHSPAEAQAMGIPVVHGPHLGNNGSAYASVRHGPLPEQILSALEESAPMPVDRLPEAITALKSRIAPPARESSPRPGLPGIPWRRTQRRWDGASRLLRVGSENARGSGKTTLCDALARGLTALGWNVAIRTAAVGATVPWGDSRTHGASVSHLGDEGAWLALRGHRVVAGPMDAHRELQVDVLLLEDGLRLPYRSVGVATVDARFPNARGLFPKGERKHGPADFVVWVRGDDVFPTPSGMPTASFEPTSWSDPVEKPRVAFAGIGRPEDFFEGADAQEVKRFPDHHAYTREDRLELLAWASGRQLVTTTRDFVRLPSTFPVSHRAMEMRLHGFPWLSLIQRLRSA